MVAFILRYKIKFFIILLFFFVSTSIPAVAKRALLVGVNEYKYHNSFLTQKGKALNLQGCVEDVGDVSNLLMDHFKFSKTEIKILLNADATRENILSSIENWLALGTEPGEVVIFYYSGHGFLMNHPDGNRTSLCPTDTNPFTLENILTADALGSKLTFLKGRSLVAIIDACHSAAVMRSGVVRSEARARSFPADQIHAPSANTRSINIYNQTTIDKIFLAAAQPEEKAWELPIEGRTRGVFTYSLINIFRNHKGLVNASKIKDLSTKYIANMNLPQHPALKSSSMLAGANWRDLFIAEPQSLLMALKDSSAPFNVDVWITRKGKKSFKMGERLIFKVKSEKSGYLYLLDIDAAQNVTMLYPNHWDRDNNIKANVPFSFPDENFRAEFIASEPRGLDTVVAIVSSNPWPELERIETNPEVVLASLNANQVRDVISATLTRNAIRGIKVSPKSSMQVEFNENIWSLGKVQVRIN